MSSGIHSNIRAIQQSQTSKLKTNKSAITPTNDLSSSTKGISLGSVTRSTNNLALAILAVINTPPKLLTIANKPSFAAKLLVSKEDLAPYFKHREGDLFSAAAAALAVVTVFLITKSGRDATDSQFLLNLQDTQVTGLNVDQLLDIRQAALLGE